MSSSTIQTHTSVRVKHETLITRRLRVVLTGDACTGKTALLKLANSISSSTNYEFPRSYVPTTFPEWVSVLIRVPSNELPEGAPPTQVEMLVLDTPGSSVLNLRGDVAGGQKLWASAQAALFVFDVTSRDSLASVDKWASKVQSLCGNTGAETISSSSTSMSGGSTLGTQGDMGIAKKPSPPFAVLVGTKADLRGTDRAEVGVEDAKQLAARLGPRLGIPTKGKSAPYFEVSAEHNVGKIKGEEALKTNNTTNSFVDIEKPFLAIAAQWARHCLEEEQEEN